jgi:hypothetical protein
LHAIIYELLNNEPLQEIVDLSPTQLEKIRSFVKLPEYRKLVRNLSAMDLPLGSINLDRYMEDDQKVFAAVSKMLDPQQITMLKKTYLEAGWGGQFEQILGSQSVIRFCGIESQEADYRRAILEATASFEESIRSYTKEQVRQLISRFPQFQEKFAQLIGLDYLPASSVINDVDFEDIPFPQSIRSLEMIDFLLHDKQLRKLVNLSPSKQEAIRRLKADSDKDADRIVAIRDFKQFEKEFDARNQQNLQKSVEFLAHLTNEQKLTMGRFAVQKQLEFDPALLLRATAS